MNESGHPTAVELAEAVVLGSVDGYVRHLEQCVECRVRLSRLTHGPGVPGVPGTPSGDALMRIVAAPVRLSSAATTAAVGRADGTKPQRGEVWRAGGEQALLVLVRKVLDGAVDAIPATLDVEFADEYTVLVPAGRADLGVPLALFAALRGHVHPDAMLSRVATLGSDIAGQVDEAVNAARDGRAAELPSIGSPVRDAQDQIVEYQHMLADMLADLGPARWRPAPSGPPTLAGDRGGLVRFLKAHLVERHPCRIQERISAVAMLPNGAAMTSVARVSFADSSLIVAELPDWQSFEDGQLAAACRRILDQEPGAHAVAIAASDPERVAIVVRAGDTREAYEPPIGNRVPPRISHEPLPLIDALAKYLDAAVPAWQPADVSAVLPSVDVVTAAGIAARSAVDDLVSQGRRARTPAKSQAWGGLSPITSDSVRDAVARIAAGEQIGEVLDELLDGRP